MIKRLFSGLFYIWVIVAFFLLRRFIDYRLFDILLFLFCSIGTFEVARAVRIKTDTLTFVLSVIFGILFVPLYFFAQYYFYKRLGYIIAILFIVLMLFVQSVIYLIKNKDDGNGFIWRILPFFYPSALMLPFLLLNDHKTSGLFPLVLIFVISPASDTFAYLVGMIYNKIKKGKAKKLCPKISPKKTVAGGIGGLIGGVVAGLIVYFIYKPNIDFFSPVLWVIVVGLISSVLNTIGDLVESYIKRKVGIKDMGRLIPGHGGVMDRIDGTTFVALTVYLFFLLI